MSATAPPLTPSVPGVANVVAPACLECGHRIELSGKQRRGQPVWEHHGGDQEAGHLAVAAPIRDDRKGFDAVLDAALEGRLLLTKMQRRTSPYRPWVDEVATFIEHIGEASVDLVGCDEWQIQEVEDHVDQFYEAGEKPGEVTPREDWQEWRQSEWESITVRMGEWLLPQVEATLVRAQALSDEL